MMRKFLFVGSILLAFNAYAQDQPVQDTVKSWSVVGQNTLMVNQSAFSNWVAGGANNVGWQAGVNYNLTYDKERDLWENIIILG